MFNLSDKELDRLSREAADAYEAENTVSSWDALEHRLDQELGNAPIPNSTLPPPRSLVFHFAYTSLIILLVGTGYLFLKSGKKSNTESTKNFTLNNRNNGGDINPEEKNINDVKHNHESKTDVDKASNDESVSKKQNDILTGKEQGKEKNNFSELNSAAVENKPTNTGAKNYKGKNAADAYAMKGKTASDIPGTKTELKNNKNRNYDEELNSGKISYGVQKNKEKKIVDPGVNKTSKNIPLTAGIDDKEKYEFKYAQKERTLFVVTHEKISISDSSLIAAANSQNLPAIRHKSLNTDRSLQIGLLFAPDFSKVRSVYEGNRLGTNIGVTIDYHLLRKFSVNSGLIYGTKYYEMSGENFHPVRPNVAPPGGDIDFVKGSFNMFEIPLNLRYDINTEDNTTIFVSAGTSSYFIQEQNYSYFCHYNLGYSRWINQSYNSPQNVWFAMLNLSAGFETNINNSLSFQMSPYVKIPLKHVGAGSIQLSSYGISVAVKFAPALKTSRR